MAWALCSGCVGGRPVAYPGRPVTYVFDHAWEQERARLAGLEWALDPGTARHLETLGVGPGWRCLEVGAGGGSTAAWLVERVSPGGRVVATDLDTGFLTAVDAPGLEVLRHDITADPLPGGDFDLVHARWMLHWLPDPERAARTMTEALRPGGWLVVEEPDVATFFHATEPDGLRRVGIAWLETLQALSGVRLDLGRKLPALLRGAGLVDVDGEGRTPLLTGETPLAAFLRLGIEKVRPAMLERGAVTAADIEEVYALLEDPGVSTLFVSTVAVWGRRPSG